MTVRRPAALVAAGATAEVIGPDGKPVTQLPVSTEGLTTGSIQPYKQGVVFPRS
ncbi:hypothetical protein ACIRVF_17745 [Kitasatospora sp. NPDC101157]|uniref:hypothetical protein n=1 Tax=Kitasatospora sp. NPDC101157 TaxID=3364098 RepID=UPI00381B87A3